jgi:translation elongation factor EF-1beta
MTFKEKREQAQNCKELGKDATKSLLLLMFMPDDPETDKKMLEELSEDFIYNILEKRISVFNLPISFTIKAYLYICLLVEGNPGKAITILIDALTEYEGKKVDLEDLIELYLFGFYNEKVCEDYIDNYLKPRKVKWAEIY